MLPGGFPWDFFRLRLDLETEIWNPACGSAFPDQLGFSAHQGYFQNSFITVNSTKPKFPPLHQLHGERGVVSVKYLSGVVVRRGWANGPGPSKTWS